MKVTVIQVCEGGIPYLPRVYLGADADKVWLELFQKGFNKDLEGESVDESDHGKEWLLVDSNDDNREVRRWDVDTDRQEPIEL